MIETSAKTPASNSNAIERGGKIIQKMCQIGLISNQAVVETCCESLAVRKKFEPGVNSYFEFTLIREALYRESNFKHQVVTLLHQKPPTVTDLEEEEGKIESNTNKMDVDAIGPDNEKQLSFEEYEAEYARTVTGEIYMFKLTL